MPSNVIKARTLEATSQPPVVKRNMQIAYREASWIVAQAEDEAHGIVTEARRQAQDIFDSAKEEGYRSGAAQWYEALGKAWEGRDGYLAENETALLKLAVRIAEKLIGKQLNIAGNTIAGIVSEALRSARRAKRLAIQVHPDDLRSLEECLATLRTRTGTSREIEIIANDALSRGDCIIETDIGTVDARLETQLRNIERALTLKKAT